MTDEQVRAGLRRLRVGTPVDFSLRLAPVLIVGVVLLAYPGRDSFRSWLGGILLAFIPIGVLLGVLRLRKDAAAGPEEVRVLYRELLERRIRDDSTMYPSFVILMSLLASFLAAFRIRAALEGEDHDTDVVGLVLLPMFIAMCCRLVYEHRQTIPWIRQQLESLGDPEASASAA